MSWFSYGEDASPLDAHEANGNGVMLTCTTGDEEARDAPDADAVETKRQLDARIAEADALIHRINTSKTTTEAAPANKAVSHSARVSRRESSGILLRDRRALLTMGFEQICENIKDEEHMHENYAVLTNRTEYRHVYQTFMIKSLRSLAMGGDQDFEQVSMVGTLIQRVIDDPRIEAVVENEDGAERPTQGHAPDERRKMYRFRKGSDPMKRPFFTYRVNDLYYDIGDGIRKATIVKNAETLGMPVSVTTMSVAMPCVISSAFNGKPYQIVTAESVIEMSSRYLEGEQAQIEYRPNLLANFKGLDNLVCVKDPNKIDELRQYDPVSPYPVLEIGNDGKLDIKTGELVNYCPKIKVYFYMNTSPYETFVKSFFPVMFATVAMWANYVKDMHANSYVTRDIDDKGYERVERAWGDDTYFEPPHPDSDYLANTIAIGLAVIFVLPDITVSNSTYVQRITWNDVYITLFFLGLMTSCFQGFNGISCWISTISLIIPILNVFRYWSIRTEIISRSSKTLVRGGIRRVDELKAEKERKQSIVDEKIRKECKKLSAREASLRRRKAEAMVTQLEDSGAQAKHRIAQRKKSIERIKMARITSSLTDTVTADTNKDGRDLHLVDLGCFFSLADDPFGEVLSQTSMEDLGVIDVEEKDLVEGRDELGHTHSTRERASSGWDMLRDSNTGLNSKFVVMNSRLHDDHHGAMALFPFGLTPKEASGQVIYVGFRMEDCLKKDTWSVENLCARFHKWWRACVNCRSCNRKPSRK